MDYILIHKLGHNPKDVKYQKYPNIPIKGMAISTPNGFFGTPKCVLNALKCPKSCMQSVTKNSFGVLEYSFGMQITLPIN